MKSFPHIFFAHTDASASTLYRLVQPAEALARAGYPAAHGDLSTTPDRVLAQYELIVVSRVGKNVERVQAAINGLHNLGIKVALDFDDDLLHLPEHNPVYGADPEAIKAIASAADAVVVTNSALAASFRPYAKKIAIVPNYVNAKAWPKPEARQGLTVGLLGGSSHLEDWNIAEPMCRIRESYPEVQFLVAGFMPDYLEDVATEFVEWVPIHQYPALVNRIDIGLCPLIDDQFNRCKTPIKAYELGMAGAAVVASPTQYGSVVRGKGIIARSAEDWHEGIEKYIVDAEKRRRDSKSLRRYVLRLDIDLHVRDIATAYAGLCW